MTRSHTTSASDPKWIEVTNRRPGYAHTQLWGKCSPEVTVEDIEKKFYHPYFGGRGAWVRNGEWGAIRHDD